ncbi:MAG: hypothetical protein KC643_22640 [Nitrospira sp.]|nr:hypothetical protein [Nitrospira sp.]
MHGKNVDQPARTLCDSYRTDVGPLRSLAVQSLPGFGSTWHVVAMPNVVCVFRGSAVKQGGVSYLNGVSFNAERVYVRTSACHNLPGGVYVTDFRSVKQAHRLLPTPQFFYLNPNTLLNQDWLLGANILEMRGATRMIAIHDNRSLLPVRLLVTGGHIREVRRRIGLPVRRCRKATSDEIPINRT